MAETIILIRRSAVSGSAPASGTLQLGELALNTADGGLFYHNSASDAVQLIRASGTGGGDGGGVFGGDFSGSFSGSVTGTFIGELEATGTLTGTLSGSASYADNAGTANLATDAVTALTASNADTASFANPSVFTAPHPVRTVASPYTVSFQDFTVLVDASSGAAAIDVQLPETLAFMVGPAGKVVNIIKAIGSNDVRILPFATESIIGDPSQSLTDTYEGLTLQPSGGTWWVL